MTKEERREYMQDWRRRNKDKSRAASKRWRDKHVGYHTDYAREWRRRNPDKVAAAIKRYRKTEKYKASRKKYLASEKGKALISRIRAKPENAHRWADSIADFIERREEGGNWNSLDSISKED